MSDVILLLVDIVLFIFFFFKHKTAYEMRISDWSSDVCSSDLVGLEPAQAGKHGVEGLGSAVELAEGAGLGLRRAAKVEGADGLSGGGQIAPRPRNGTAEPHRGEQRQGEDAEADPAGPHQTGSAS